MVDYLDVTFNLNDGTYQPYRKENDETIYINAKSNHPPNIIKQLPISVEDRLRNLSSNKKVFEQAVPYYKDALERSGFTHKFEYKKKETPKQSRQRSRKIIWFNPPFSKSVSTNVAKDFLKLVDKHFSRNQKLKKIFNRDKLKVSYSCMRNIGSKVTGHNRKILNADTEKEERKCNCPRNAECPLDGHCLAKNTIYSGKITSDLPNYGSKEYIGLSAPEWKKRLANHKSSFSNRKLENSTEISKEIWRIKDQGGSYNVKWSIVQQAPAYNPASKRCHLCITETLCINSDRKLLNTRNELVKKCRHQNKYALMTKDTLD